MPITWSEGSGGPTDNTYSQFRVESVSPRTERVKRPPAKPPAGSRSTKASPPGAHAARSLGNQGRIPRDLNESGSYTTPERSAALGPFGRALMSRAPSRMPGRPLTQTPEKPAGFVSSRGSLRPAQPSGERSEGVAKGTASTQFEQALQRRQGSRTGTASMNPEVLRDRAARLRARMTAKPGTAPAAAGVGWSAGRSPAYGP